MINSIKRNKIYSLRYCCKEGELLSLICDCLMDVVILSSKPGDFIIPVLPTFSYLNEEVLVFTIGSFCVVCENNPPDKQKMVEIINEAYNILAKIVERVSKRPMKVKKIEEVFIGCGKEHSFQVQIAV